MSHPRADRAPSRKLRHPSSRRAPDGRIQLLACLAALALLLPAGATPVLAQDEGEPQQPRKVRVPAEDLGARTLEARGRLQRRAARDYDVFHGFRFTDRRDASDITFVHRIVDDAGLYYKPVHYDHGNGVAAADIDGDGYQDLYFTTQLGRNELWRNQGDGTFEDWTDRAGVGLEEKVSVTASFGDVDNDGDPDLFVTTVKMGNHLFENLGDGRFRDVSERAGVDYVGHSSAGVFFDYDLDGLLDLFVTNVGVYTTDEKGRGGAWVGLEDAFSGHLKPEERAEPSILYRNLGDGRFEDVTQQVGLVHDAWSGDASFADLDGDLWPELYVLNMQGDDHYFKNVRGERFVDRTREVFPKDPWGAMGIKFFDFENDGDLDLILTDMHSDMLRVLEPHEEKQKMDWDPDTPRLQGGRDNLFGNAFWRNEGDLRFREISDQIGAENFWPWGLSAGDLNADGYQDLFITSSMNYPFRYGVNSLLLNEEGRQLRDAEFLLGIEPREVDDTMIPWFEVDCSDPEADHVLCERFDGPLVVYGNLGTRSSVILDLENDGDLDIVTNEFNSPPQVLVSNLTGVRPGVRHLEVELVGTRSNRDGLGALVTVRAGDRQFVRWNDGKSGYLSQSSLPLWFGLGDTDEIDAVEVRWPSGVVQTVTDGVARAERLVITEPAQGEETKDGAAKDSEAEPDAAPEGGSG